MNDEELFDKIGDAAKPAAHALGFASDLGPLAVTMAAVVKVLTREQKAKILDMLTEIAADA